MKPYAYVEYIQENITNKLPFFKGAEISKFTIVSQKNIVLGVDTEV
jgi:hypothetical protein